MNVYFYIQSDNICWSHGILQYEEYHPNALEETYGGVGGYIYSCEKVEEDTEFELSYLKRV